MERLDGVLQGYAWGDPEAIPQLLGIESTGEPVAEYWMGAHPKAPGRLVGADLLLDAAIAADPVGYLGDAVNASFGRLPFLAKILAAGKALSIQSHPSKTQAEVGYARENADGVALDAFERTYRDDNHKPELICALTEFHAKCGFRAVDKTQRLFDELGTDELEPVRERLSGDDALATTMAWLLGLDKAAAASLTRVTVAAAAGVSGGEFVEELAWTATINEVFPDDIGVVVALLLNHIVLQPGEAIFLDAGNLHAYLRGTGVEIMANSDNVIRGGLTPKHIDIDELLAVLAFSPIDPPVQRVSGAVHRYNSPVPDFSLTRVAASETPAEFDGDPLIVLATEGSVVLASPEGDLQLSQGQVAYCKPDDGPVGITGDGVAFVAAPGE